MKPEVIGFIFAAYQWHLYRLHTPRKYSFSTPGLMIEWQGEISQPCLEYGHLSMGIFKDPGFARLDSVVSNNPANKPFKIAY
jgi:hypothetical protein